MNEEKCYNLHPAPPMIVLKVNLLEIVVDDLMMVRGLIMVH